MKRSLSIMCSLIVCLSSVVFLSWQSAAFSSEMASGLLVDTNFIKDNAGKPGWVILDVRFPDEYGPGHIPGAVLLPGWISKLFIDDTKRAATVIPRLEREMGGMGIGIDSHVIVYGRASHTSWNAVMFWVLESMGCNSSLSKCKVHFYDGGIDRWQAEGGALEQAETKVKATTFKAVPGAGRGAIVDEVMDVVKDGKKAAIVDVRKAAEYEGLDVQALRGGHIPKAVNIDYAGNFDPETFRMRPPEELKKLYKDIPSNSRVITYCGTGARAAYTYLVLRYLGYNNVAIYHDGWRVYGSNLNYPVEDETWFDFQRVNRAVKAVQELQEKSQ